MVKGDDDEGDMRRDKILLRRRVTPQRVTLPNGQSFVAKYEMVSRKNLPRNVIIKRAQQIGPRRQRKRKTLKGGSLLGNIVNLGAKALTSTVLLKKSLDIGSKAISSEIGKKIIDEGIKHAPDLYKFGTSKIKNKNLKRAFDSDIADYAAKKAEKNSLTGNMAKEINTIQIVFPANQMNRFIDYKTIISEKNGKYSFNYSEHW